MNVIKVEVNLKYLPNHFIPSRSLNTINCQKKRLSGCHEHFCSYHVRLHEHPQYMRLHGEM